MVLLICIINMVLLICKPRLVIDYSRTINKFTLQDAYPLPNLDTLANKIANFRVFSAFDLRSAYHQVPILDHENRKAVYCFRG